MGVEREIITKKISWGARDSGVSGGGRDAGGGKWELGGKSRKTAALSGLVFIFSKFFPPLFLSSPHWERPKAQTLNTNSIGNRISTAPATSASPAAYQLSRLQQLTSSHNWSNSNHSPRPTTSATPTAHQLSRLQQLSSSLPAFTI